MQKKIFLLPYWFAISVVALTLFPTFSYFIFDVDFSSLAYVGDTTILAKVGKHAEIDKIFYALNSGGLEHGLLEWSSVIIAMITVLIALSHFSIVKDATVPVFGVALLCAGAMDAFHTLAALHLIDATVDNNQLIPFTWALARMFNALVIIAGVVICLRININDTNKWLIKIICICALFIFTAYSLIHYTSIQPSLPQVQFPNAIFTRPFDVIPLGLFILLIPLLLMLYKKHPTVLTASLLLMLVPQIATQIHMSFGSSKLFDNHFNIAHGLKILVYTVPLIGLLLEYIKTYIDINKLSIESENAQKIISAVLNTSHDSILTIYSNGNIASVNNTFYDIFGYKHEEIIGENINILISEENVSEHEEYLSKYIETGDKKYMFSGIEIMALRKNGDAFHSIVYISPINISGKLMFTWVLRNVSDEKYQEQKLIDYNLKLEMQQLELESSLDLNEILYRISSTNSVNEAFKLGVDEFCKYSGLPVGHVYKYNEDTKLLESTKIWHVDEGINIDEFKVVTENMTFASGFGMPGIAYSTKNPFWLENISTNPEFPRNKDIKNMDMGTGMAFPVLKGKKVIAILEFFSRDAMVPTDILLKSMVYIGTQMGQVIERAQGVEDIKSANLMKTEFLATMSHEIRTPMNGVIGMTELLLASKLNEKQEKHALTILNSADNLLDIINEILDFSKIEAGNLTLENTPLNLKIIVDDVIDMISPKSNEKGLELLVEFDDKTPKFLFGDAVRIRQIIINLVGNAIKFTKDGSITIIVGKDKNICPIKGYAAIKVEVKDTGIGIPKELSKKIFERFSQADSSTTRKYGGTGLGLSICSQLVEMMDGEIGVESEASKGANFWFNMILPINDNHEEGGEDRFKEEIQNIKTNSIQFQGLKVLLVEDNRINMAFETEMLSNLGIKVTTAENGREALDVLQNKKYFDIILMDCHMPIMDGYEATKEICKLKKLGEMPNIPVIALTANAMKGDKDKCLAAGMDDYLSKPIRKNDIQIKIIQWVESSKMVIINNTDDIKNKNEDVSEVTPQLQSLDKNTFIGVHSVMRDSFAEMVDDFIEDSKQHITTIKTCYEEGDAKSAILPTHTLKSSGRQMGALYFGEIAANMEKISKNASENGEKLDGFSDLIEEISKEFEMVIVSMKKMLKDLV